MFLNMTAKPKSLAGRLTLWYTLVSTCLFLAAVALIYLLTASALLDQVDDDLEEDILEFNSILSMRGLSELWSALSQEAQTDGSEQVNCCVQQTTDIGETMPQRLR